MIISNQPLSTSRGKLYDQVHRIVQSTPALDMHTHLYDPAFGDLLLSGIDEQLVYHYLVAETFRSSTMGYEDFWKLPRAQQADHVWSTLFQERSPAPPMRQTRYLRLIYWTGLMRQRVKP